MPWKVVKQGDKYKLYNLDKKTYVNINFKSKQTALNAKRNYENYYKRKV
jgi:hypothetical protein